jgi:hypothetical protein
VPTEKNGRQNDRDRGRAERYGRRASTPVTGNGRSGGVGAPAPMYVYAPQAVGMYYPPSAGPYYSQVPAAPYQAQWVDGHGVPMQMSMYGGVGGVAPAHGYYLATPPATGASTVPMARMTNGAVNPAIAVPVDNSFLAPNFGSVDDAAQTNGGAAFTYTTGYGGYAAHNMVYPEGTDSATAMAPESVMLQQGTPPFGYNGATAT